jgi:hypothetical protein
LKLMIKGSNIQEYRQKISMIKDKIFVFSFFLSIKGGIFTKITKSSESVI